MNKFICIDTEKLRKRYRNRMIIISIPFVQATLVIMCIVIFNNGKIQETDYYSFLSTLMVICWGSLFTIYLNATLYSSHLIKVQKMNTFIDLSQTTLIFSQHCQTVYQKLKPIYYKKLYIIKLSELEDITLVKGKITVSGKIRCLTERADRLLYNSDRNGISFDTWWFDYNSGTFLRSICILDNFKSTPKLLRLFRRASLLETQRKALRLSIHEEIIKKSKATKKIVPYKPRYKRKY